MWRNLYVTKGCLKSLLPEDEISRIIYPDIELKYDFHVFLEIANFELNDKIRHLYLG